MTDLGILIIKPWQFKDHRGQIVSLHESELIFGDKKITWHHDMISVSKQNVLRGIHVSPNLWKLVTCVYGRIFLVVVDCRAQGWPPNPNFGKWQSWTIDDSDPIMILIPPGFGLAHLVLSKQAVMYYKWTGEYDGPEQLSYKYNDERFKIVWPIESEPILSERDAKCCGD